MPLIRDDEGVYHLQLTEEEGASDPTRWPAVYVDALPRYLTAFDLAFTGALGKCEFWYLLALLRVRGFQDAGWDPFETTLSAIPAIQGVAASLTDFFTQRHLQLWIYGHIVEASEPYEVLQNMVGISAGREFNPYCFPNRKDGRPQSPGEKIRKIRAAASAAGMPSVVVPLEEMWDRDLRNAIFHADYSLFRRELRIRNPLRSYTHDEVMAILNRALAVHHALSSLYRAHMKSYSTPKLVDVPKEFSGDPHVKAQIIVREGDGLAGVRAAWIGGPSTPGVERIQWSLGRYLEGEAELLSRDPTLLILPPPPTGAEL